MATTPGITPIALEEIARRAALTSEQADFLRLVHEDFRTGGALPQAEALHQRLVRKRKRATYHAGMAVPEWLLRRHQKDHGDLSLSLTALRLVLPDSPDCAEIWRVLSTAINRYTTDGAAALLTSQELGLEGNRLARVRWFLERGALWFLRPESQQDSSVTWKISADIDVFLDAQSLDDVVGILEAQRLEHERAMAHQLGGLPVGAPLTQIDLGTTQLASAPVPAAGDPVAVERLRAAESKFFRLGATDEDRRDAIRDLAAALEHLRPRLRDLLLSKQDERALFEIANRFAIRHENPQQRRDYGTEWLVWIFHVFYATVRVGLELTDRAARSPEESEAT